MAIAGDRPRVVVLLAVYDGMPWLPAQVDSILRQEGVDVRLVVSDDGSTDGSMRWLLELAARDDRVRLLPATTPSGSSGANFRRLIIDAPIDDADAVSFADQDDVWRLDKLATHWRLLLAGADAVSSNVTAVTASGTRVAIRKDWPQRRFDWLTESPGPGSTFLLGRRAFALVRAMVGERADAASAQFHDWLIYAIVRGGGLRWRIDGASTVDYRQHDTNVLGANVGTRAAARRLRDIRSGWHRRQAVLMGSVGAAAARATGATAVELAELDRVLALLADGGPAARLRLAARAGQLRRRPRDRVVIGTLIALGIW